MQHLTRQQMIELIRLADEIERRNSQRIFYKLFPEVTQTNPDGSVATVKMGEQDIALYSRHLYQRHMEFFEAGATYTERCFMAANRVGKTFSGGGYETACHLTGLYPPWWPGLRFTKPIRAWVAGDTYETTRDIIQTTLFGQVIDGGRKTMSGTGVVPGEKIIQSSLKFKTGVPDLLDTIRVQHVSGKSSLLGFKSYVQGRKAFQGTAQHWIWLDEEPPADIYNECLMRTATTRGAMALTFTPLSGMSDVVLSFLPKPED